MIKPRNSKVKEIVGTIAANKRTIVRTKLAHVLISRLVQQPLRRSKMPNTHVQARNASNSHKQLKKL